MLLLVFAVLGACLLGAFAGFLLARSAATAERGSLQAQMTAQAEAQATALRSDLAAARAELERARSTEAQQATRAAGLEASAQGALQRIADLERAIEAAANQRQQLEDQLRGLTAAQARVEAELRSERTAGAEKLALLNEAREQLSNQFKALANDILEEKSRRFTEQNAANLGTLLHPLREKFGEFQQKVESLEKDGVAGRSELKEQIAQLRTMNQRLSEDATNLVSALKGSSKTQGDWGELVLEKLLEDAGLRRGFEYLVQETYTVQETDTTPEQKRPRPDVVLNLPEGKHIVIDSKVSLVDYNDYCAGQEESLRAAALKRHIASMREHIRGLAKRNYQQLYQLNSLDFVVLFVPIEPAFMLALGEDQKLWEEAWDRNVLLVSRTSLLFVLRTVAHLWRQEQQTRNVQAIVREGGQLYDKLATFAKDLTDLGKELDSSRRCYEQAMTKLSGRGGALRRAELLRMMGVQATKSMPAALLEATQHAMPGNGAVFEPEQEPEPQQEQEPLTLAAASESDFLAR